MIQSVIRFFRDIFGAPCTDRKRYRRSIGGTWYQVADHATATGISGAQTYWTQHKPMDEEIMIDIIGKEVYP